MEQSQNIEQTEQVSQTAFDQLVCSEQCQMLKAVLPYLPFQGQQILASYAKIRELRNTLSFYAKPQNEMQMCAMSSSDPTEIIENIRRFSYGQSRKQLDQVINMIAVVQLMQTINDE